MFSNFLEKSCRLWDNIEKCGGARKVTAVTVWRIRVACWINKTTCTRIRTRAHAQTRACAHTQSYNIYCFSTATMIRQRASMLRYAYIASLVFSNIIVREMFVSSDRSGAKQNRFGALAEEQTQCDYFIAVRRKFCQTLLCATVMSCLVAYGWRSEALLQAACGVELCKCAVSKYWLEWACW